MKNADFNEPSLLQRTGQVLANACGGGLILALVGVICCGMAGALTDWIFDNAFSWTSLTPETRHIYRDAGARIGALAGFVTGALLFGRLASKGEQIQVRFVNVVVGQVAGVAAFSLIFYAFEVIKSWLLGKELILGLDSDATWLLYGAPALMICGAIAGALSKRNA